AAIGSAEMACDDDLENRQHLPLLPSDEYPSLSWAAAAAAQAPITLNDAQKYSEKWYRYYGPDNTIPHVSYYQALQVDPNVPEGFFSNKVVFIGARILTKFYNERKDAYPSPYWTGQDENKFMPGVEIQATGTLNLIRGDWLQKPATSTERIMIIILGAILGLILTCYKPFPASI